MVKWIWAIFICAILAGACTPRTSGTSPEDYAYVPPPPPTAAVYKPASMMPYELGEADVAVIQDKVKRQLDDPESARFVGMKAARDKDKGSIVVCGLVDSKNSYGGYTGEQPFVGVLHADRNVFDAVSVGGDRIVRRATLAMCRGNTLVL
jgi:hypothetical protein